jgi:hypothetical protein
MLTLAIRALLPGALAAALGLAGCATARPVNAEVAFLRLDGPHLRVRSAYLRAGPGPAEVRGMVTVDPLRRGPVEGRLQVTAYDAGGAVLARRIVGWSRLAPARRQWAGSYVAALDVAPERIARVEVAFVSRGEGGTP